MARPNRGDELVKREEFRIELVTFKRRSVVNVFSNGLVGEAFEVDKVMTLQEAVDYVLVMKRLKDADA
jgi:hypothetical protein